MAAWSIWCATSSKTSLVPSPQSKVSVDRGLAGDQVVPAASREQEEAAVLDPHADPGVVERKGSGNGKDDAADNVTHNLQPTTETVVSCLLLVVS